ncbi:hypothetical protein D1007_56327 [Hordeum vulgare]|nr:hypothetical protein D1007_56327 [Hordeum vulgare]
MLVMMLAQNTHGVDPTWRPPTLDRVLEWCDNLKEVHVRHKEDLVRHTTEEEVEFITQRVAEAGLIVGSRSCSTTTHMDDDEKTANKEVADEEALLFYLPEELAGVDEARGDVEPRLEDP